MNTFGVSEDVNLIFRAHAGPTFCAKLVGPAALNAAGPVVAGLGFEPGIPHLRDYEPDELPG